MQRIVEAVHPLRIVLFGSAAREEMGPESDVDVLVVMPEGTHRRHTMEYLHTQFSGLPFDIDVMVATPADLEKHRHNVGMIYYAILDEGKELYAMPDHPIKSLHELAGKFKQDTASRTGDYNQIREQAIARAAEEIAHEDRE
ncbi:MAG: nucleotidyltransferase domain-containing protein [Armatimonadota bacterium]